MNIQSKRVPNLEENVNNSPGFLPLLSAFSNLAQKLLSWKVVEVCNMIHHQILTRLKACFSLHLICARLPKAAARPMALQKVSELITPRQMVFLGHGWGKRSCFLHKPSQGGSGRSSGDAVIYRQRGRMVNQILALTHLQISRKIMLKLCSGTF